MPNRGPYRDASVYLGNRQASYFSNPRSTGVQVVDSLGVSREILAGIMDADQKHFGLFDSGYLIASLWLDAPKTDEEECPSPFWSVGMMEVSHDHQGKRLGPCLYDEVFKIHGQPLASDLDQEGGGADIWERWIVNHPGDIELHAPHGICLGVVVATDGTYAPNPWASRTTRLVRMR